MSVLTHMDETITVPERVSAHIVRLIEKGGLKRGDRLPSYRTLMKEVSVSLATAKRGVDLLATRGIVHRQPGQGCFVKRGVAPQGRHLRTLGVIYPASCSLLFSSGYSGQIMQGLTDDPAHPGLHIFSARDQWLVSAAQLAEFMVDGVLLVGVENDDYLRKFAAWGIPGVVVDYGSSGVPLDCVACDNEAGARRAVRYLLDLGHRRIAYVEWKAEKMAHLGSDGGLRIPMRSSDAIERREAVTRALGEAPDCRWQTLTFDISPDPSVPASVRELAAGWRKEKDHPTAFLTSDDSTANQLITALTEQGVDVPREVSVCAVAGAGVPLPGGLLVTQSRFDFSGMGRKALEILRQRCEHPSEAPAPDVHRVGFEWLEGSSTSSKTGVTQ